MKWFSSGILLLLLIAGCTGGKKAASSESSGIRANIAALHVSFVPPDGFVAIPDENLREMAANSAKQKQFSVFQAVPAAVFISTNGEGACILSKLDARKYTGVSNLIADYRADLKKHFGDQVKQDQVLQFNEMIMAGLHIIDPTNTVVKVFGVCVNRPVLIFQVDYIVPNAVRTETVMSNIHRSLNSLVSLD